MERIVESKVFTDEQKVSIIKAVVDKSIVLDFVPEFVKIDDYYFIKNENTYQYVMTFKNGFEWMNLGVPQDEFIKQFVFNKMNITNSVLYCAEKYIVVYNKETIFPYMRYDSYNKLPIYFSEGKNYRFIKHMFSAKLRSATLVNFIEYVAQNEIETVPPIDNLAQITFNGSDFVFRYTDNSYSTIYKTKISKNPPQPEKDKFMIAVDGFADSETLKKTITVKKIDMFKQRVIDYISKAIENNEKYIEMYKSETYSTPEITEFLKYICDTKKYTITTTSGYFRIEFY